MDGVPDPSDKMMAAARLSAKIAETSTVAGAITNAANQAANVQQGAQQAGTENTKSLRGAMANGARPS